jgi:hypothetical protein
VKGGNVLVVPGTGRVVLTDFGSGKFRGAATLTNHLLPPGTPVYRSPEAWEFARLFSQHPSAHYEPGMCDDLFSLGVLGYRLVTDEYPPPTDPGEEGSSVWYGGREPRGPRELNPNVSEELDAIIRRLLEVHPVERFKGLARLAAEALERAAWGPGADRLLFDWEEPGAARPAQGRPGGEEWERRPRLRSRQGVHRSKEQDESARVEHERQEGEVQQAKVSSVEPSCEAEETEVREAPEPARAPAEFGWRTWGWVAVALGLVVAWVGKERPPRSSAPVAKAQGVSEEEEERDSGSAALGDNTPTAASAAAPAQTQGKRLSLKMPNSPLPGQRRPPCDRSGGEVEVRGGCWYRVADGSPPCRDDAYEWEGSCYVPTFKPKRGLTSDQQ